MNWEQLIHERDAWIAHNFPSPSMPDPGESIMGCIEELGELCHAHLKQAQNIRGDAARHVQDAQDAVGDLTIYLLGVMSAYDRVPSDNWTPSWPDEFVKVPQHALFRLSLWVGKLAHGYIQGRNGPVDGRHTIDPIIYYLRVYVGQQRDEELKRTPKGQDITWSSYDEIVTTTWHSVRERDWIAYPENGLSKVAT